MEGGGKGQGGTPGRRHADRHLGWGGGRRETGQEGQGGPQHVLYLLISKGQRLLLFWFCVFRQLQSDVEIPCPIPPGGASVTSAVNRAQNKRETEHKGNEKRDSFSSAVFLQTLKTFWRAAETICKEKMSICPQWALRQKLRDGERES